LPTAKLIADFVKTGTAIDLWPLRQAACGCPEIVGWMVLDKDTYCFGRQSWASTLSWNPHQHVFSSFVSHLQMGGR
jgi:hypothetical protein